MAMSWEKLVNATRIGGRPAKHERGRSPFNSDHDKIIFSGAFRRLARKTQVHPLATNDHVHNRLTHSLEVACVGRSLGIRVGEMLVESKKLPPDITSADIGDIVQSTCLAHDIGNPPFGHTGEAAIRSWFSGEGNDVIKGLRPQEQSDLTTFEGNAQGLRVLTTTEYHPYEDGMRLTYATLASFIKYPWTSLPTSAGSRPKENKYGVFTSEKKAFHEIAGAVGLIKQSGDDRYCRHPFVALMEAADDFCYAILDLEDGLEMSILGWDEVFDIVKPVLTKKDIEELEPDLAKLRDGRKPPVIRGRVIDAYVESAARAFMENEAQFLEGKDVDLISLCSVEVRDSVKRAKALAKTRIFTHPRKIELEIGSYNVMATLLSVLCQAALENTRNPNGCAFKTKRVIDLIGPNTFDPRMGQDGPKQFTDDYLALMRVLDFISGCTDHYATYLAKQFLGMGQAR